MNVKEFLWVEKYRPRTIENTILPERMKTLFEKFIEKGDLPNLIFAGSSGVGKTTVAKALVSELGSSVLEINGSLDGNKDTLRNEIREFATSMSVDGKRKYVLLDEADGLTPQVQPALRTFMEDYSSNCGFILTCNLPHKIIEPLHSRCSLINFKFTRKEKLSLMKQIVENLFSILTKENVEFDKKTIVTFVNKFYPDIRKMIGTIQKYSANGKIDAGLLTDFDENSLKTLLKSMKAKSFDGIRDWISHSDIDQHDVYQKLYDISKNEFTPAATAALIVLLGEYQYKAAFAINPDINLAAALLEISANLDWKK